jgi:hypothetical protein
VSYAWDLQWSHQVTPALAHQLTPRPHGQVEVCMCVLLTRLQTRRNLHRLELDGLGDPRVQRLEPSPRPLHLLLAPRTRVRALSRRPWDARRHAAMNNLRIVTLGFGKVNTGYSIRLPCESIVHSLPSPPNQSGWIKVRLPQFRLVIYSGKALAPYTRHHVP